MLPVVGIPRTDPTIVMRSLPDKVTSHVLVYHHPVVALIVLYVIVLNHQIICRYIEVVSAREEL